VAAALEERLHESWTADAGDELLVRGAAHVLDTGRQKIDCVFRCCSLFL
jgi:hypothetical protein